MRDSLGMSIVSDLLALVRKPAPPKRGKAPPPEPGIPELEAAIAKLQAERGAAESAIYAMPGKREALLREDGTDAAIMALERVTDGHHLLIERLDRIEPELFGKLQALRTEARHAQWLALRDRYVAAAAEYHGTLLTVLPRLTAMGAIAGEMIQAGFHLEANARPAVPWAGTEMQVQGYLLALETYAGSDVRQNVRVRLITPASDLSPDQQKRMFGAPLPTPLETSITRDGHPLGNFLSEKDA